MKVAYMTIAGEASSAYTVGAVLCGHGCYQGFDRHTDASVMLRWDGRQWTQAPSQCATDNHPCA